MTRMPHRVAPPKTVYLWLLPAGPLIWALHFLLSYVTAAVWCAKFAGRDGAIASAHTAIAVYTVAALVAIGIISIGGYRRHGRGWEVHEHGMDTAADRQRFLVFATLLLGGLSAVATIYVALSASLIDRCY